MRASPIASQVCLVLVVPDKPSTGRESLPTADFDLCENLGESTDIGRTTGNEDSMHLGKPCIAPLYVRFCGWKDIPSILADGVRRIGDNEMDTFITEVGQ